MIKEAKSWRPLTNPFVAYVALTDPSMEHQCLAVTSASYYLCSDTAAMPGLKIRASRTLICEGTS